MGRKPNINNIDDDGFETTYNSNIPKYSLENTEQTFVELASEQRLSILLRLAQAEIKLSQLAKDLGVTMQEVHRNVNR